MTTYGLTPTGFVKKPLDAIKAEVEASLRSKLGAGINLGPTSVLGQIVGILCERHAQNWDVMEALYNSQYPNTAGGQSLDNVSSFTGVTRLPATPTTMNVYCTGDTATALSVGRVVSLDGGARFESAVAKTLAAASPWASSTAYTVGDVVSNDSSIYYCSQAGTSAASGGPTGAGDDIVDNACRWDFVGDGLAFAVVPFMAEETGPTSAVAGSIDTEDDVGAIETPVSGWSDARNMTDGTAGRDLESDADLRLRRALLLRATGRATLGAIRGAVLEVDGVTAASVFENTSESTNGDGLPAKSIEVLAFGGVGIEIAEAIWVTKAGGINTHGSENETVVDENGENQTVRFSRPTQKAVHVTVEGTTDSDYPADGNDQIKAALKAYGNTLGVGDDVITAKLYQHVFSVSGVVDVTKLWIALNITPTGDANLSIGSREISDWDTDNISVTMT